LQVHAFPLDIELAANHVQCNMMENMGEAEGQQGQAGTADPTTRIVSSWQWIQGCSAAVFGLFASTHAFLNPSAKQFATWCVYTYACAKTVVKHRACTGAAVLCANNCQL
jgi:hypothetical protein